ncbi:MAG: hypothetical protein WDM90_15735 [Ferruginibacter sp.]
MSMELFSMDEWETFFDNDADLLRAKEHQLERVITIFPWIAIIDKFQHWILKTQRIPTNNALQNGMKF